jgi:sodium transport system permease protein
MKFKNQNGWKAAGVVFRKEFQETLRDGRTLLMMVVIPVLLYPAMLIASQQLALFGMRQLSRDPSPVALVGDPDSELLDFLGRQEDLVLLEVLDLEEAIRSDQVSAGAVITGEPGAEESQTATLLFDAANDRSRRGVDVLSQALRSWGDTLLERRILGQGLPEGFARPLVVSDSSVARPEELGGYALGRFLPMLLVVITLFGTFYPAIDLAAGEKERGTLETLLTAPVPAGQVVAGKFLAVAFVGLMAAALNLGSMLLTFQSGLFQLSQAIPIDFALPLGSILMIFATLVPLAILFGALFLGIALRSRSFKEAQNALTPVYMLVIVPALLPLFPGIDFTPLLAVVPVAGVALFFRELMSGDATLFMGILVLLSTLAYACLALIFAADSFGREEVLFGNGGDGGEAGWSSKFLRWIRGPEGSQDSPSLGATITFVAVVAVLFFYGAMRFQAESPVGMGETGILVSEVALLLFPVLLFIGVGGFKPVPTLSLRRPKGRELAAALFIIGGGTPLAWLLAWLQGFVIRIPSEYLEGMGDLLIAESFSRVAWLLLILAATPAICEELLFRGVLLAGTRRHFSFPRVVLLNGLVFGAFHLFSGGVFRLLPTAWLGILLAWVVLRTGSIWTGFLMHFINNGSVVVLAASPWIMERFSDPSQGPPWWMVLCALASLASGAFLLEGGRDGVEDSKEGLPDPGGTPHRLQT